MAEKYPVAVLSIHPEIGDLSIADCYPQIVEHGTEQNKHEVPRIVFRACLPPRLKDGEKFNFVSVSYVNETVDNTKTKIDEMAFMPDSLYYIYVGQYKTLKTPVKTLLTKKGFEPNDIVNTFFDGRIEKQEYKNEGDFMQVFSDEEKRIAVVVGSIVGEYFWNVCAAVCPRIIPWYFGVKSDFKLDNHPLNEDEKALVRSVDIGDNEFVDAAQKIYDKTDIASQVQAIKFRNMYRGVRQKLIQKHKDNIHSWNSQFASLEKQIQDLAGKIREASILRTALEAGKDEDGSELARLFTRPNLAIKEWKGNSLCFTISSMVSPFDMDSAEEDLNNDYHEIYNDYENTDLSWDEARDLLLAVFVDRKIKLPVYSNFELSMENSTVVPVRHQEPAPKFRGYTAHPHHEYYGCTGSNIGQAAKMLAEGNYPAVIAQLIGSVATITFSDSTVMNDFGRKVLWNTSQRPYLLPDGTMVNCKDAYAWLKEHENEEDE